MKQMRMQRNSSIERKQLAEATLKLAEAKKKQEKLTEMWMTSVLDETVYENALKELKAKVTALEQEKTELEMKLERDTSSFDWAKLMMKFRGDALSDGEFETLVHSMLKKVVVYKEKVDVITVHGTVSLPRQKIGRYNNLCGYELQMKNRKASVCYYGGYATSHDKEFWSSAVKIGVLGDLEVYWHE
jgi:hypothetical protein